jgi:phytanoyl-CoA dioxygenase PhyH
MTAPDQSAGSRSTTVEAERSATTEDAREALAAADALAQDGRFLEAVELLSEANRRRRDAEIETRLVRLRNQAYDELDRSLTEAPWPEEPPRPRDAGDELPAVSRDELTPEQVRDQILRYGCAYVPGLVPAHRADQLVDGITRAFDVADANPDDPVADAAPWFYPWRYVEDKLRLAQTRTFTRDGGGVWTVESPRVMFDFLEILEEARLSPLIGDYLGERPAMTLKKSTLRKTTPLPHADWHQDGAFLGDNIRTINLWLCLSHCGDDAPGLDLVPRRFERVLETGTGGAFFPWSIGDGTVEEAREDVPVVRPIFEPGDALLFDELFLHRTATDETMTRTRFAIETWFFAPSLYPGDQIPFVL